MALKRVEERLLRLGKMVEKWNSSGEVPHIERDLALDELRRLYDELIGVECGVPYAPVPLEPKKGSEPIAESTAEPEPVVHKVDPIADFDDALDIDALLGITDDEPQPAAINVEPEPVVEPMSVAEPAPVVEPEPVPQPNRGGGLFAIEDIPVRSKSSRKMINLYNSPAAQVTTPQPVEPAPTAAYVAEPRREYVPQPQPMAQQAYVPHPQQVQQPHPQQVQQSAYAPQPAYIPQPQPEYVPQPAYAPQPQPVQPQVYAPQPMPYQESVAPQRVGDVLGSGRRVVGDVQTHDSAPIAPMNKISDLRKAIGLNDKFLLLRDLFNGDVPLYERTIDTLNAFEDLDECLIYIVENFRWNPDSEGAKMLVSLIERKLS